MRDHIKKSSLLLMPIGVIALLLVASCGPPTVTESLIENRDGLTYRLGSTEPFTGQVNYRHPNGKRKAEAQFSKGKLHGVMFTWRENGEPGPMIFYEKGFRVGEK